MRHKSTVYGGEYHNQFQETEEKIKLAKQKKAVGLKKEVKEGQSEYRIQKLVKKNEIS